MGTEGRFSIARKWHRPGRGPGKSRGAPSRTLSFQDQARAWGTLAALGALAAITLLTERGTPAGDGTPVPGERRFARDPRSKLILVDIRASPTSEGGDAPCTALNGVFRGRRGGLTEQGEFTPEP